MANNDNIVSNKLWHDYNRTNILFVAHPPDLFLCWSVDLLTGWMVATTNCADRFLLHPHSLDHSIQHLECERAPSATLSSLSHSRRDTDYSIYRVQCTVSEGTDKTEHSLLEVVSGTHCQAQVLSTWTSFIMRANLNGN